MLFAGACHCGNVEVEMSTEVPPDELEVRSCGCSFCSLHAARTITDPAGRLLIRVHREHDLSRYRFGLRTADFLVCRQCGAYIGAVADFEDGSRATLNIGVLDDRGRFSRPSRAVSYDGESAGQRQARRRERWTPASVEVPA